jgi:hypothetical protein
MARWVPRRNAIDEIRQLLDQQRPFAHCDACLALHLGVSLAESRAAASAVASEPRFGRKRAECYTCRRSVELTSIRGVKGPTRLAD